MLPCSKGQPAPDSPGARLRRLRLESGWTQTDLAHAMGLTHHQSIKNVESGRHAPTLDWLLRAAKALQIEPSELSPEFGKF